MKYKRFTKRDWNKKKFYPTTNSERAIRKRLWDLENKIEQGTLVDTESYFIVEEKQLTGKNRFLIGKNDIQLAIHDFCETREEAEKKLKKIQKSED